MANCIRRFLLARDEFVERRLHRTERGHPARSRSATQTSTGFVRAGFYRVNRCGLQGRAPSGKISRGMRENHARLRCQAVESGVKFIGTRNAELDARRWNTNMILSVPFPPFTVIPTEVGLVGIGVLLLALAFVLHRRRAGEEKRDEIIRPVLVMQFNANLCTTLQ